MDTLLQDVRYAIRTLRRSPGFTIAAVLTLALGIGANTAIFSVVDGVLLRPAPFADVDRLVMVWETDRNSSTTREPSSVPDYLDFQQRAKSFERLAAFAGNEASLTPPTGDPTRLATMAVSHEFLSTVGLVPLLGRGFSEEEDRTGGPAAAMISEDLWVQLYARDPGVLGRTIRINDVERPIIGVLPSAADFGAVQIFRAADYGRGFAERGGRPKVDLWLPLAVDPASLPRDTHPIFVLGRLAPGITLATAQQEMTAITADLEREYNQANVGRGANIESISAVVFGPVRPALYTLLGAVALVLLVACANVANLMLVRGAGRLQEVTVRTALGAGAQRLARQFVVEGAVLTVAGAVLGVVIAVLGLDGLLALAPADIPRVGEVGLDGRVLLATLGMTALVGLVFGFLPTFQARRMNLQAALKDEGSRSASAGREHRMFRSTLVVTELALAVMLMIGAGLLIKSLARLQGVDPGFAAAGVVKAQYQLPASRYPQNFSVFPRWPATYGFNEEIQRRVAGLPGVQSVAVASNHPLESGFTTSMIVVGREAEGSRGWPEPAIRLVSPSYFGTLSVPLVEGRPFQLTDNVDGAPVAIINEAARRLFFTTQNPIGQQVRFWGAPRRVVGVVGNERFRGLDAESPPSIYVPAGQVPSASGNYALLVRTTGNAAGVIPSIRTIVRELDPSLPLFGVEALDQTVANSVGQRRFTMLVLGIFAAVALLLAIVGVHGVLTYSVSQRTREIGIRMALGADLESVRKLVLGQGAALVGGGVAVGLIAAFALSGLLRTMLYGVGPADPLTFVGVALLLGIIGLVASYLPARRAMHVDPAISLRKE